MTAVYDWIKNITFYLIFIALMGDFLASSSYEKYLRFFAGTILVLIVFQPLTRSLNLDGRLAGFFENLTVQGEAGEFKEKLWGMEEQRVGRILDEYEQSVEDNIEQMALEAGYQCGEVKVFVDREQDSASLGQVTQVYLELLPGTSWGETALDEGRKGEIQIEPVHLDMSGQREGWENVGQKADGENVGQKAEGGNAGQEEGQKAPRQQRKQGNVGQEELAKLTGKVAEYYGLEETHIQVEWKDD